MDIKESLNLGLENKKKGTVPYSPELKQERVCPPFPKLYYSVGIFYE